MYHWFLIAVLFFGIATAAHALRICHSQVGRVAFVDSVDSVGFFFTFSGPGKNRMKIFAG